MDQRALSPSSPAAVAQLYSKLKLATWVTYGSLALGLAVAVVGASAGSTPNSGPASWIPFVCFSIYPIAGFAAIVLLWKTARSVGKSPIVYAGGAILLNGLLGLGIAIMVGVLSSEANRVISGEQPNHPSGRWT